MERGQENDGEREKGKANNSMVSSSAFRKDVVNVLDFIERLKNKQNQIGLDLNLIEALKYGLAFICTSVQLSYFDLDKFEDEMARKGQEVEKMVRSILYMTSMWMLNVDYNVEDKYDMHHVLPRLMDNIDDCITHVIILHQVPPLLRSS
ncbi:hypothetical protein MTR67_024042 [Solanum verrucosum]|uniref:Uncharacterized protein n=1 Tax=Solanum verrucosum TaxID=315347 RepID=A0AAF0QUN7_SOLVR|nr:hypothetical protein MTR67_024042 [Solanum verrucosum]